MDCNATCTKDESATTVRIVLEDELHPPARSPEGSEADNRRTLRIVVDEPGAGRFRTRLAMMDHCRRMVE